MKKRCNVPITSKFSRYKRPLPHCAAVLRAFSVASHAAAAASAAPGVTAALLPFFGAARLLGSHPHKVARCATSRCGLRSTPHSSCSTGNRRLVERFEWRVSDDAVPVPRASALCSSWVLCLVFVRTLILNIARTCGSYSVIQHV